MRFRRKKWARPELGGCPYFVEYAERYKGVWQQHFARPAPLVLEIGCGKGVSSAPMAHDAPENNFLLVDIKTDMLGYVRRALEEEYKGEYIGNVLLTAMDAMFLSRYLAPGDIVSRIVLNFSNPWDEKLRHEKRRLTHPRQLMQYREVLVNKGEIWFKTDSDTLFEASLGYFAECGFSIRYLTRDLHASGFTPNYESEHEKKYIRDNVPIKFCIAVKEDLIKDLPENTTQS